MRQSEIFKQYVVEVKIDEIDMVKVATASIITALYCDDEKKSRKRRSDWDKPWLQRRDSHGIFIHYFLVS